MPVRIYLDNCCYNRPYDDQSQIRISLEAQAKLYIQEQIKDDNLELVSSYTLSYEVSRNPYEMKRNAINQFLEDNVSLYIDESYEKEVHEKAMRIMETGIKSADAHHAASAIVAKCDYLVTTDDRLLKYVTDEIKIVDPPEFIKLYGGDENGGNTGDK